MTWGTAGCLTPRLSSPWANSAERRLSTGTAAGTTTRASFSIMLAGGGVQGGQVIGASDPSGMEPAETPVRPEDLSATIYQSLGIDYNQSLESPDGVRIVLSRGGRPVRGVLA